jgi:SAM-dependent methyltransferase
VSDEKWLVEEVEAFSNNLEGYISAFYNDPTWKAIRDRSARLVAAKFHNRQISVLDVGSGPMPSLPGLYRLASRYVCVEPSVAYAENLLKNYSDIIVIQDTLESLVKYEIEKFDVVLSFGVLHHIYSPGKAVDLLKAWVKNGGLYMTHEPSDYWNGRMGSPNERGFSRDELLSMIRPHFNDIRIYSHFFPNLRRFSYRVLSGLRLWPILKSQMFGKTIIEVEFFLDRLGYQGTDFLVVAV